MSGNATLYRQMEEYIEGRFTGIWVETQDPLEAQDVVVQFGRERGWRIFLWDAADGLREFLDTRGSLQIKVIDAKCGVPHLAINSAVNAARKARDDAQQQPNGPPAEGVLLITHNLHRFIAGPQALMPVIQTVHNKIVESRVEDLLVYVINLSCVVSLPDELQHDFVILEHSSPGDDELLQIATDIAEGASISLPAKEGTKRLIESARGLSHGQAESAFSLSVVRHGSLRPDTVFDLKSQALHHATMLSVYRGQERFEDLGGLSRLKSFCTNLLNSPPTDDPDLVPRGVVLVGVPGSGKSAIAKALGNETGRPTISFDVSAIYGRYLGDSEKAAKLAFRVIDSMAPCILFIDEVEKALAGENDSTGAAQRFRGVFLTWLNDHRTNVFTVATSNDISNLPSAFTRAERFDGIFFVDLPTPEQRRAIWDIYLKRFGVDPKQKRPEDDRWTGAEIRTCCRLARMFNQPLQKAAESVVPVAVTASESIAELRHWADKRCLSTETDALYLLDESSAVPVKTIRSKVRRPPGGSAGASLN